jgi:hypothetical protein
MQYLTSNLVNLEGQIPKETNHIAYNLSSNWRSRDLRRTNSWDNFQLVFTAGFKSTGVVENITGVVRENEFVLDVMHATLKAGSSGSAITNKNTT